MEKIYSVWQFRGENMNGEPFGNSWIRRDITDANIVKRVTTQLSFRYQIKFLRT